MSEKIEIQDTKVVWVVYDTKDKTEGRTQNFPWKSCETLATAKRIAKGRYVMGSDCPIHKSFAVKINHEWLYPGKIEEATKEDLRAQDILNKKESLEDRLKEAGFTEEDIRILRHKEATQ